MKNVPKGWKVMELSDAAAVIDCKHITPQFISNGIPIMSTADISWGKLDLSRCRFVSKADYERLMDHCTIEVGDIIMSRNQSVGIGAYVDVARPFVLGQDMVLIKPLCHNKRYLYHFFESEIFQKQISRVSGGSTFSRINLGALRDLVVSLPSEPEQAQIAEVLSLCDEAIYGQESLLVSKSKNKLGLLQQLLTGKKRFKEFADKKWTRCVLGDVVQSVSRPVVWNERELYRLASVRRNAGGVFAREELSGHQIKVKKLQTIRSGDFLISHIQAAYGAMALVPGEFDGAKVSELYTILRPVDPKVFDIRFLAYLGQTKRMWYMAIQASNGFFAERLRLNLDPEEFLRLPVAVPPTLAEQVKIVSVLSACDREIELLEKQLEALKEQKRGLMQKLLTGEVRVKI